MYAAVQGIPYNRTMDFIIKVELRNSWSGILFGNTLDVVIQNFVFQWGQIICIVNEKEASGKSGSNNTELKHLLNCCQFKASGLGLRVNCTSVFFVFTMIHCKILIGRVTSRASCYNGCWSVNKWIFLVQNSHSQTSFKLLHPCLNVVRNLINMMHSLDPNHNHYNHKCNPYPYLIRYLPKPNSFQAWAVTSYGLVSTRAHTPRYTHTL